MGKWLQQRELHWKELMLFVFLSLRTWGRLGKGGSFGHSYEVGRLLNDPH